MSDPAAPYALDCQDYGRVRVLTLDRPEKLNALNAEAYRLLTEALDDAAADDAVAVCAITGRGRAFCSGVDLAELRRPGGREILAERFDPLLERLAAFEKPLLAAVNGLALGLGATLLLYCDLIVVDEDAEIRFPFAELGTVTEASSSWLLPARVGPQQAAWMVLSGRSMSGVEAVRRGLAFDTAPTGRALEDVMALAQRVAVHPTPALVANKRLLREGWADAAGRAWERERTAMVELADQLGPLEDRAVGTAGETDG